MLKGWADKWTLSVCPLTLRRAQDGARALVRLRRIAGFLPSTLRQAQDERAQDGAPGGRVMGPVGYSPALLSSLAAASELPALSVSTSPLRVARFWRISRLIIGDMIRDIGFMSRGSPASTCILRSVPPD